MQPPVIISQKVMTNCDVYGPGLLIQSQSQECVATCTDCGAEERAEYCKQ